MKNLYTESPSEQNKRIDAMLKAMIVEACIMSLENDEALPHFTRDQIGDFCGCSKDTIRRIEERALAKVKRLLA